MRNLAWYCGALILAAVSPGFPVKATAQSSCRDLHISGLIEPLWMDTAWTEFVLEDYFLQPEQVVRMEADPAVELRWSPGETLFAMRLRTSEGWLFRLSVTLQDGCPVQFLLRRRQLFAVTLRLPNSGFAKVQVKGEMNAWNPADGPCQKEGESWVHRMRLPVGQYQYLFVVDGEDRRDPANLPLPGTGYNSVLTVGDPEEKGRPHLYTVSEKEDQVFLAWDGFGSEIKAFWDNVSIPVRVDGEGMLALRVPKEATTMERSALRIWSAWPKGLANDLYIPLANGRVMREASALRRSDFASQIMYFTLVDRFRNGDTGNDSPIKDDRVLPMANYLGGDLAGIRQSIDEGYFDNLGVNALWLSPVTQNPLTAYQEFPEPRRWYTGYHGYWPISSSNIDHRFGDDATMYAMVDAAHAREINLLLDYVCNHVHEEHPLYRNNPELVTVLDLPDGRKNIRIWDEHRLTTWFDSFMPSLDLENPKMIEWQTDSTLFWMKKFNLDGYRHDATKHIPTVFWRRLTQKVKTEFVMPRHKPVYQIGETYGSRQLISSYIGNGMLDSQFDFNLHDDARQVFGKQETSMNRLAASMRETFRWYGSQHLMGNISGNHDMARFISLAGGSLSWDEDAREAGFQREIGVGDPIGYRRLRMLHTFNYTIPGVPVLFYGDEIGMAGANDPDCRRMMRFEGWSPEERRTFEHVAKLGKLRRSRMSLNYGSTRILVEEDDLMVIARHYFGELSLAVLYKGVTPREIEIQLPSYFQATTFLGLDGTVLIPRQGGLTLSLQPWESNLLTSNQP